ncbi:MAG TPA: dihydrolipoyl dehydrogenase [archaeon]|nr:dihydrolipoyl dehydrogenase [archaeon]
MKEQTFDLVVIGSGTGLDVANACASRGLKVAIVEEGAMGGTCLNRGCIPSKMYIHCADVAEEIRGAKRFGITAKITKIDYASIVKRVRGVVDGESMDIESAFKKIDNPKLFKAHTKFIGVKKLLVGKDVVLRAEKFLIAAGARTTIPPIPGLDKVPFLTSETALSLKKQPKVLTILGGGYIAAELAHFFGALGTKVSIVQRNVLLLPREDREVAEKFTDLFGKKYNVLTGHDVLKVELTGKAYSVTVQAKEGKDGKKKTLKSDALLVATGITPNSDSLEVTKTGLKPNARGFIPANEFLETSVPGIFTLGDIHGKYVFKHSANHEAKYAFNNILNPDKMIAVDYTAMPHAIFTSPQIAGVGFTEQELEESKAVYASVKWPYIRSGMGEAILDRDGFVKFLYEPHSLKILGCHIIGTHASTLIHEVLVAMKHGGGTLKSISDTVHIHPALSEVVQRAANKA